MYKNMIIERFNSSYPEGTAVKFSFSSEFAWWSYLLTQVTYNIVRSICLHLLHNNKSLEFTTAISTFRALNILLEMLPVSRMKGPSTTPNTARYGSKNIKYNTHSTSISLKSAQIPAVNTNQEALASQGDARDESVVSLGAVRSSESDAEVRYFYPHKNIIECISRRQIGKFETLRQKSSNSFLISHSNGGALYL